ncbi:hypothetical protein EDD37DRAFT_607115 [Exophiala viscosa]|uniref:uncharacterized protein n=1 Tax=Exophiala viscosa TaxID=2486360 RepID=UPI00219064C7|nr:hypothetical protein EDD37DRAFT_607115 [Exophiala viscosa]
MAIKNFLKLVLTVLASSTAVALPQVVVDNTSEGDKKNLIGVILTNKAGVGDTSKLAYYDPTQPVPEHTCPRDFLATLANWAEFCGWDGETKRCRGAAAVRSPTLVECCGYLIGMEAKEWYENNPISDVSKDGAVLIGGHPEAFRREDSLCADWKPENDMQYAYYMSNLDKYGLRDIPPHRWL